MPESSENQFESPPTYALEPEKGFQSEPAEKTEIDVRPGWRPTSMQQVSLNEFQTAGEALQAIAAWSDMSVRDLQMNAMWWKKACDEVRTSSGRFPPMLETAPYRSALEKFESFCSDIETFQASDATDSEAADVNEIFDRIERAIASPPELWSEKIDRLGRDGAIEAAFKRLGNAIRNLDELKTQAAIMNIIDSGLYPRIEETGPGSEWALVMLSVPPSTALLCRRLDGCRGPAHPHVVKYCLLEYGKRNRLCDSPSGIEDAIYQTLTPVEFNNYLQLYGWLTSQLSRWSD